MCVKDTAVSFRTPLGARGANKKLLFEWLTGSWQNNSASVKSKRWIFSSFHTVSFIKCDLFLSRLWDECTHNTKIKLFNSPPSHLHSLQYSGSFVWGRLHHHVFNGSVIHAKTATCLFWKDWWADWACLKWLLPWSNLFFHTQWRSTVPGQLRGLGSGGEEVGLLQDDSNHRIGPDPGACAACLWTGSLTVKPRGKKGRGLFGREEAL